MSATRRPDRMSRGNPIPAHWLRAVANAVVQRMTGANGVTVRRIGTSVGIVGSPSIPRVRHTFLARITGHTDLTANVRWRYAWVEVVLDDDADVDKTDGRVGSSEPTEALNLTEMNNTAADAIGGDGVDSNGADYPANFKRRPIGSQGTTDTHAVDVVVVMFIVVDSDGNNRYVFSQPNAHDGTC